MRTRLFIRLGICFGLACAVVLAGTTGSVGQDTKTKAKQETKTKAAKRLDLNTASAEELDGLPGVGPATSKKIIEGRPYTSVDQLSKAGISASELDKIRDLVTVQAPAKRLAPASKDSSPAHRGPINVNTADVKELEDLPGIGPALAAAIVKDRPFKSFADMERVKGLGPAKIAGLNGYVKFGAGDMPASEKTQTTAAGKGKTKTSATEKVSPARTERAKSTAAATPAKKVNINTASKETLDGLPGIGPVKAQAIIDARPFKTIEDIKKVKGIKDVEFNEIKDLITVQ